MAYNCYDETLRLCPNSPYTPVACKRAADLVARKAPAASGEEEAEAPPPPPAAEDASPEANDARAMYQIGERCRRRGDLAMACNCYREAQLMAPDSTYGRQASKRLRQIQAGRQTDAEEQEPPLLPAQPESSPAQPPVLFVPPLPRNLRIEVNEQEDYEMARSVSRPTGTARSAAPAFDFDIEIAPGRSGAGLRAEGIFRLGKLGYKATYDDYDGHYRLVVVPSKP
jgi:hypothetical protein